MIKQLILRVNHYGKYTEKNCIRYVRRIVYNGRFYVLCDLSDKFSNNMFSGVDIF